METEKDTIATKLDVLEATDKLLLMMNKNFRGIIGLFIGQIIFVFTVVGYLILK